MVNEAVTATLVRTKRHNLAVDLGRYILESPRITKVRVEEDCFLKAWEKFKAFRDKPLSFTDCTSLALIENSRIKRIMSFDVASTG